MLRIPDSYELKVIPPRAVRILEDRVRRGQDLLAELFRPDFIPEYRPIFVVVVAVDPRWLAQSLHSRYRDLLGIGESNGSHATRRLPREDRPDPVPRRPAGHQRPPPLRRG